MSGQLKGLFWFEETICELASMYHLNKIHSLWSQYPDFSIQFQYSPSLRGYLDNLLNRNSHREDAGSLLQFLQVSHCVEPQTYHRYYYNALAAKIYPFFLQNPKLWRIIPRIGNSRQWNCLQDLLRHLLEKSDDDYSPSLFSLYNFLFPYNTMNKV